MREFVRDRAGRCGLSESTRFRAALVATEAVTNAMRHGLAPDGAERAIEVACDCNGEAFVIEVGDRGRFEHTAPAPDASGGRGLGLIERFTRQFELEASQAGTRLRMTLARAA